MLCPSCGADNDRVQDSRSCEDGRAIRRRRCCIQCNKRFTTYERIEHFVLQVVKKGEFRESFQREKIEQGIERACWKRPISADVIRRLATEISSEIHSDFETEVPSRHIGQLVMDRLAELDQVAYVRFASVYREFKDVQDFVAELGPILKNASSATKNNTDASARGGSLK